MSLALNKIDVLGVNLPILDIDKKPEYAIIHSGNYVQYKQYQSTSFSVNSFQFSCPPPSEKILTDRKVLLRVPVTITINGTVGEGVTQIWNQGYDALRSYAVSTNMQTLQATINNSTATIQMSDVIQPLLRYHNPECLRQVEYSLTPSQLDNAQNYEDLLGSIRNPLATYSDADDVIHRGAFPYTIVSNTTTQAVIQTTLAEYLYLSPFYFGHGDAKGFYGVRTMDFNFTWNANLDRFISHAAGLSTISSINILFAQPSLLFQYVTPPLTMQRPVSITYPYYIVNRFPTGPTLINSNVTQVVNSNNIQLNSIPRRMYIFARQQNSEQTSNSTDTFAEIQNISIQFENYSGLLASASEQDLYNISKMNGLNMSWTDWTGGPVQNVLGGANYGTCGSVLCICPGKDIGLPDNLASGIVGQFMFQYNITLRNPNVGTNAKNINYMLYLVTVDEGTWTIENGQSIAQGQGVVSQMDVLEAKSKPWISYDDVAYAQGSGRFFSGLKTHMKRRIQKALGMEDKAGVLLGGVPVGGVSVGGGVNLGGGVLLGGSINDMVHDEGSIPEMNTEKIAAKNKKDQQKQEAKKGGKAITPAELKARLKGKYI